MSEIQWSHTLYLSLNQEKQDSSVLPVAAIFQILDVLVPKPDDPVSTG
jgi:hypothetical protein